MTLIIEASNVRRATRRLETRTALSCMERLTGAPVESCSEYATPVVPCSFHPFVEALHTAFAAHYPVVLSPDMFWLLVAQGFARIVNENSFAMRRLFVRHEGKVKIVVQRDEFLKGSPENDWPGVFGEFSDGIREQFLAGFVGFTQDAESLALRPRIGWAVRDAPQ